MKNGVEWRSSAQDDGYEQKSTIIPRSWESGAALPDGLLYQRKLKHNSREYTPSSVLAKAPLRAFYGLRSSPGATTMLNLRSRKTTISRPGDRNSDTLRYETLAVTIHSRKSRSRHTGLL